MPLINLFKASWKQEKERIKIQALFCPPAVILWECIKPFSLCWPVPVCWPGASPQYPLEFVISTAEQEGTSCSPSPSTWRAGNILGNFKSRGKFRHLKRHSAGFVPPHAPGPHGGNTFGVLNEPRESAPCMLIPCVLRLPGCFHCVCCNCHVASYASYAMVFLVFFSFQSAFSHRHSSPEILKDLRKSHSKKWLPGISLVTALVGPEEVGPFSTMDNQIKRPKFPSFEHVFLLAAFFLPLSSCPPAAASCVLFVCPPCRHTLPCCCVMGGWRSWTMDEDIPVGMEGDKLQHSWMSGEKNLLSTSRPWGNIYLSRAVRISLKIYGLVFSLPQDGKKPVQMLWGGISQTTGVACAHLLLPGCHVATQWLCQVFWQAAAEWSEDFW